MEKHLRVLGILFIVYGVIGLIGAATVFIIFFGTALGIYALWALLSNDAIKLFNPIKMRTAWTEG